MSEPIISLICAMAKNRVIGKDNQMPWHLPADLKHFKTMTMGKPIVMGRKTFDSIGRPLPGRRNVVITRNREYKPAGVELVGSVAEALLLLKDDVEIMITGGGNIYQQVLPMAHRLYLTFIDLSTEGDAFFPEYDHLNLQQTFCEAHIPDDKNALPYTFVNYDII